MGTIGAGFSITSGIIGILVLIATFMVNIRVGSTVLALREIKKILNEIKGELK